MPEGALPSDEQDKACHENDTHRLLKFELETVLVQKDEIWSYSIEEVIIWARLILCEFPLINFFQTKFAAIIWPC